MTSKSMRERISEDGLRYKQKSSSNGAINYYKQTRSCYFCSKHHPQSEGIATRLMGRQEYFCSESCKEKIFKSQQAGAT
jgi:YHS domain-containing protein